MKRLTRATGLTLLAVAGCRSPSVPVRSPEPTPGALVAPVQGPAPAASVRGRAFKHPGILLNRAQLELVRTKVGQGAQPWTAVLERMNASFGDLSRAPRPRPVVECGPYSRPNHGCSDERNDAVAAYTHALLWQVKGNQAHAIKAVEILDAWATTIREHTGHNARLQSGWAGAIFPRAAEIIRHTYPGWAPPAQARFETMLRDVYLPMVTKSAGNTNGNWDLVMIEAAMEIGVFLDDRTVFDRAVARWRRRVPAYLYLSSDGPLPVPPPEREQTTPAELIAYWHQQQTLVDGLAQETCRDFGHTTYGIASIISAAETAFQQGLDLYREQSQRLRAALELHADYLLGTPAPDWLCGGRLDLRLLPTWEIGYNHFHNRLGLPLPLSRRLIETRVRQQQRGVDHHITWETFTHAEAGWVGLR